MSQHNKIFSYLGLAARARRLVSGEFSTEQAVKRNKAYIVIVATDASENTKKNFRDMCTYYKVNIYFYGNKENIKPFVTLPVLLLNFRTQMLIGFLILLHLV